MVKFVISQVQRNLSAILKSVRLSSGKFFSAPHFLPFCGPREGWLLTAKQTSRAKLLGAWEDWSKKLFEKQFEKQFDKQFEKLVRKTQNLFNFDDMVLRKKYSHR